MSVSVCLPSRQRPRHGHRCLCCMAIARSGEPRRTTWSPTLKRLVAIACINAPRHVEGTGLRFEITVEGTRHFVGATVVRTPFFNPAHKTATPPAQ